MSQKRSHIEELMARKLGKDYARFVCSSKKDKIILFKKLKEVLSNEVDTILKQNGMFYPPFDPFKILKIGKARINIVYTSRGEVGAEGSIEVCDNGFMVKIDKSLAEKPSGKNRLRSTMAHELMHAFFHDVTKLPPVEIGYRTQLRKQFLMEEELCNYLAREFLVPTFSIIDLMEKEKFLQIPSLKNVEHLKSTFITSSDIIAYRMISDLSIWNAIFIKFLKSGAFFKSKTKLKNKSNRLYKRIKIPSHVPLESLGLWPRLLSNHIMEAAKFGLWEEIIEIGEQKLALESKVETIDPVCIMTLIYEID